ncbi:hypothetical protein [Acinetobacter baumannii]|uniref:hypothetical protein n=1 Tax=Acinetobacter baumannii TaxID=470 RepID=UPI001FF6EF1D|nr:hypothetical protein [Acinetobacter baumannii]MCJ8782332.1 hypothetical protein [Acinetobacter baumannii]MCJ9122915.1 hypothetical protein [Acinetobacter baumannii]
MMQKIQQAGGGCQNFQALRRWTPPPISFIKKFPSQKKLKQKVKIKLKVEQWH